MKPMASFSAKALYEKYGFLIYGRCLRILCSEDDAKDAVQEIFLKLLDQMNHFTNEEHIVPWIYTVSKNYCFNVLRSRKKFVSGLDVETFATGDQTDTYVIKKEIMHKVMDIHSKKVQEAVYYTYIEKLNQTEIYALTGQSPATIRRNLSRFKKSLPHIAKRLDLV